MHVTQIPGQAFICPDCCLYYGNYLIRSFIQVKMVDIRLDSNNKECQWKLYLIVGWNELDGYQIHFIGTSPYLLRTLLDIVAEVISEDQFEMQLSECKELDFHDFYQRSTNINGNNVERDMKCEQCGASLYKVKGSKRFGVRYLCNSCREQWKGSLLRFPVCFSLHNTHGSILIMTDLSKCILLFSFLLSLLHLCNLDRAQVQETESHNLKVCFIELIPIHQQLYLYP